jgi:transketolase
MRDAFVAKLLEIARDDPKLVLITGDLGFGVLKDYMAELPDQFINAGVAEQNMTMLAAGMAMSGWRAFTYSIANFTTLRCLEQIRNDLCYHDLKVTIISVGGGFSYGQLGMSHFATEDLAILRALPNLRVITPAETWEAQDLLADDLDLPGPSYFRIDKSAGGLPRRKGERARIGKARMIADGNDLTIVTVGGILAEANQAAEVLRDEGIFARVLSLTSLKPLDESAVIAAARETGGIIALEEHSVIGGLGSAIAECCLSAGAAPGFFRRIGLPDVYPSVVGDQNYLRHYFGLDAGSVARTARELLAGKLRRG